MKSNILIKISKIFNQRIIGVLVIIICHCFTSVHSFFNGNSHCATFSPNDGNGLLTLRDSDVIGNSAQEYLTPNIAWNISGVWSVNGNCQLTVCDDRYLKGSCLKHKKFRHRVRRPGGENWLSAGCECTNQCNCNHVHLRRSVCARAYIGSNEGCNNCRTPYTELEPGETISFSEEWMDKVASILVRPGCTLRGYEEEDLLGEPIELEGSNELQEWGYTLGSYECECPAYTPAEVQNSEQYTNGLAQIDIPQSFDDVAENFAETGFNHPGLLAAMNSLTVKRSSRNAYILVIGSSGAGKSSTINILMRRPNVTVAGDHESTTSEILEFRIPVPVPELGIKNSELRIIDTPGLGDTRGLDRDALFLATLDDYLSKHEELKTQIPNLVLVFHKYTDNRFDGESSKFVKMIRGLNSLRTKITDEIFSNVLFVFAHYCSVPKNMQRDPTSMLMKFRDVIDTYSLFPKPVMTAVVENKGKNNDLPMIQGNFLLPNQEYFPQNLLQKFESITMNGKDRIGNAIIRAAFGSSKGLPEDLLVQAVKHYMVSSSHNKVAPYLSSLNTNSYNVASTEVSKLLQGAFDKLDDDLKARFPDTLENLQKYFNLRNIRTKSDLPQTTLAILRFLKDLRLNEVNQLLLEKGLGFMAPTFPQNMAVGHGFNILTDSILPSSPFKLDELKMSTIGFMVPKIITSTPMESLQIQEKFDKHETKQELYDSRLQRYFTETNLREKINNSDIFTSLTSKAKPGVFVREISCKNEGNCTFVVSKLYKKFVFNLNSDAMQNAEFFQRINSLPSFNSDDHYNVEKWISFFNDFGTHIVTSADGGGRIDFHISTDKNSVDLAAQQVLGVLKLAEDTLIVIQEMKIAPKTIFANAGAISHSLVFHGGDPTFHVTDFAKLTLDEARKTINSWKLSLDYYPAVFPDKISPMVSVLKNSLSTEAFEKLDESFLRLLNSTLKYIPLPPTPDPKLVEELERKQREQEEEIQRLKEQQRKEKEAEEERQRQIKLEQERLQEEARKQNEERKRVAAEAEREKQRKEREREEEFRRLQEEQRRQREREEAERAHQLWLFEEEQRKERERIAYYATMPPPVIIRRRSSCLKQGTRILLADYSEKAVESLKVGDMVLDKDLQPVKVLGVSYEFLMDQKFYGFDNRTFFFTDTHLFVGPSFGREYILYTTSTDRLYAQNPLLEYLNITQFEKAGKGEPVTLLHFDGNWNIPPIGKPFKIYQDPAEYNEETLIYFLQVDSPSGTYIAEGFVSRHEVPPLEHWPNTMPALFPLFGSPGFRQVAEMSYTIDVIHLIDKISDDVRSAVMKVLETENFWEKSMSSELKISDETKKSKCKKPKLNLDDFNLSEIVGEIFGNPTAAALGMEIYGGSGSIIALYLDNPKLTLDSCLIGTIQNVLLFEMGKQIELSLSRHRHYSSHIL